MSPSVAGKSTLFTFLMVATTVLGIEIVFRVVFPVPEALNFNRIHYSPTQITPEMRALTPLSNAAFVWVSDPDEAEFTVGLNLYGFRGETPRIGRLVGRRRALFVGDSFVEGFMVADGQTIPDAFAARAEASGQEIDVLNLGIGASDFENYFPLIRDALPLFRPDDLFLVVYANDVVAPPFDPEWLLNPLTPKTARMGTLRVVYVVGQALRGEPLARRWRSRPFPFAAAIPDPSNPWSSPNYAARARPHVDPEIRRAMEAGRFNPFAVNEYDQYRKLLVRAFDAESYLRALGAYAAIYDVQLHVAYLPSRYQVSDAYLEYASTYTSSKNPISLQGAAFQRQAGILREACVELDIPFLDLSAQVREIEAAGKRLYWSYDSHMNAEGYREVGTMLHAWWSQSRR
jgi:hypothetical protein